MSCINCNTKKEFSQALDLVAKQGLPWHLKGAVIALAFLAIFVHFWSNLGKIKNIKLYGSQNCLIIILLNIYIYI